MFTPRPQPLTRENFGVTSGHNDQKFGNESPASNVSDAGSSTDINMDSDDEAEDAEEEFRMTLSHSPEDSSLWSMRPSLRQIKSVSQHQPSSRVATPMVFNTARPRPAPLQTSFGQTPDSMGHSNASNNVPISKPTTIADRLPSPIDEDEPHTPTTAAGSQLSLLTVNDMDIDVETPSTPGPRSSNLDAVVVRKQRQRSGAFISTPDAARKLSMGYRDDCEKCRSRVPGHLNHFLGTV